MLLAISAAGAGVVVVGVKYGRTAWHWQKHRRIVYHARRVQDDCKKEIERLRETIEETDSHVESAETYLQELLVAKPLEDLASDSAIDYYHSVMKREAERGQKCQEKIGELKVTISEAKHDEKIAKGRRDELRQKLPFARRKANTREKTVEK